MSWVLLGSGVSNENCISSTDCETNIQCYGLEYLPGISGTVTSYTTGFLIDCIDGIDPVFSNQSCIMTDNSVVVDGCSALDLVLLNGSGNSGTTILSEGDPVIIHQVCLNIPASKEVSISEDATTGLTVSIDVVGGGSQTDFPDYQVFNAMHIECPDQEILCGDTVSCSRNFGLDSLDFDFDNSSSSLISALDTTTIGPIGYSFDIYDEENNNCGVPGGLDDILVTLEILACEDVYGNEVIDEFGGEENFINQNSSGLIGNIALGVSDKSETSTGDIRGYKVSIDFASHLEIKADQFSISLAGINSSGSSFESTGILFKDQSNNDYGSLTYNGFYENSPDLSGACNAVAQGNAWISSGIGVFVVDETVGLLLDDPCTPIPSGVDGSNNDVIVNAHSDTGVDANDLIGGFEVIVISEDVAMPNALDDGSGNDPDDGIAGNAMTSTSEISISEILGFRVDGCVQFVTSSLQEVYNEMIEISPVPFDNVIRISLPNDLGKNARFEIYSLNGEILQSQFIGDDDKELIVSTVSLFPGTYLIRIQSDKNSISRKVIKI